MDGSEVARRDLPNLLHPAKVGGSCSGQGSAETAACAAIGVTASLTGGNLPRTIPVRYPEDLRITEISLE
jgi:hypothetical protein